MAADIAQLSLPPDEATGAARVDVQRGDRSAGPKARVARSEIAV